MQNIGHFFHAWLVFVTPLTYLGYRPDLKKQSIFTILYGLGVIFFRRIYEVLPVPFGIHMVLLVLLSIILFTTLIEEMDLVKSVLTVLIIFSIMMINDSIVMIPIMKFNDITVNRLESLNKIKAYVCMLILSNLSLIIAYIIALKTKGKKASYSI